MIDEAFQGRHVERAALRNKTGKMAISIIDQKVCETIILMHTGYAILST